jgi:hypothetical protein
LLLISFSSFGETAIMMHCTLFLIYLIVIVSYTIVAQNQQQKGDFQIFKNTKYIASQSYNAIANITGNSVSTIATCAKQCLEYQLCQTATYYMQSQICSLYQEKYGLGQLINVSAQTASVISLKYRNPLGKLKERYCYSS